MVHRIGAGVVGLALIFGVMKFKENARVCMVHDTYSKCLDTAGAFWLANVFVGGLYIVYAKMGDFPESLSLLHLVLGVASFLSASIGLMLLRLSEEGAEDE